MSVLCIVQDMTPDQHGNVLAKEGNDRCSCGCKYWENDKCTDCGDAFNPDLCVECYAEYKLDSGGSYSDLCHACAYEAHKDDEGDRIREERGW